MVFEGIDNNKEKEKKTYCTLCLFYLTMRYSVWALGVAYIIYACVTTKLAFLINWFLSLSIWIPLSRISFSAYLIHEFVIKPYAYGLSKPMHFQETNIVNIIY